MVAFKILGLLLAIGFGGVFGSRDDILKDGYFGKGAKKPDDESIKPFTIAVPDSELAKLKGLLQNARITHTQLEDIKSYEYGFTMKSLLEMKDYWQNTYDWRKAEKEFMTFPNFKTQIEGLNIHFIHARPPAGKYKTVKPLLASHGWPGSVHEFTKAFPIFTDPKANGINSDYAFEVIAPSIPGYGWSDAAQRSGLHQAAVARLYMKLMKRLGFNKFFVQGGDWGSTIVGNMARLYPDKIEGCHLNMLASGNKAVLAKSALASAWPRLLKDPDFKNFSLKTLVSFVVNDAGYLHLFGTQPDTVGIALNDSPIGLMAWILEKFALGTNLKNKQFEDGRLTEKFSKDDLITSVMVYWVNGNMLQSARFYKELFRSKDAQELQNEYIKVPTGYLATMNDAIPAQPEAIAKAAVNLKHYGKVNAGHFAAMEQPKALVQDFFAFTKQLIK
ncbi:unnamed protein product [Bursaphelenchus xylophilus]|uniref:Epoxide hydrolase n=1 Tax=Bursaphelenchus xylophilus TaxID=6326 RepID=A0A1I7RQI6_BURXY|nr:unnamed protein product [Bursaphelenchus xylophilus]CAG9104646.1 unnamed protein product [Bursaphelenchus xylophilus]